MIRQKYKRYYGKEEYQMKFDKVRIISMIAMAVGFAGSLIANKADELAREQMRDEIKDEVLSEIRGDE